MLSCLALIVPSMHTLILILLPVAFACIVALLRRGARQIAPGSGLAFSLGRVPLFTYLAGGVLLAVGAFASVMKGQAIWDTPMPLLVAGWGLGTMVLYVTRQR